VNYQYWGGLGGNHWKYLIGVIINGIPSGIVEIPTSITTPSLKEIKIYPNPVTDILTLDMDVAVIRSFELHDLHGRLLMHGYIDGSIDLGSLNPGIYSIRLLDENHLLISQARVIIQ
jgi:hypothetical protein